MPLDKILVSRTFHLGDSNFFKIGQEGTISDGETREQLTEDVMGFIHTTVKKYFPNADAVPEIENKKDVVVETTPIEEDKEWNKIKKKLATFEFIEDAQEYLNTTDYKLLIQAKQIVQSKPNKIKK